MVDGINYDFSLWAWAKGRVYYYLFLLPGNLRRHTAHFYVSFVLPSKLRSLPDAKPLWVRLRSKPSQRFDHFGPSLLPVRP